MNKTKFKPLGSRVLVQREEIEEKQGGILLPDAFKEKSRRGVVVEVGAGKNNSADFNVKIGDTVIIPQYGALEMEHEGEKYVLVNEEDILGVVQ